MKTAKEWLLEQLNGFENHEDYNEENIKAIADFMEHYAKYYNEQKVNSVDLADVGKRYTQEDLDTAYDSGFNEGIANAM